MAFKYWKSDFVCVDLFDDDRLAKSVYCLRVWKQESEDEVAYIDLDKLVNFFGSAGEQELPEGFAILPTTYHNSFNFKFSHTTLLYDPDQLIPARIIHVQEFGGKEQEQKTAAISKYASEGYKWFDTDCVYTRFGYGTITIFYKPAKEISIEFNNDSFAKFVAQDESKHYGKALKPKIRIVNDEEANQSSTKVST
jgi:hypothetical protein